MTSELCAVRSRSAAGSTRRTACSVQLQAGGSAGPMAGPADGALASRSPTWTVAPVSAGTVAALGSSGADSASGAARATEMVTPEASSAASAVNVTAVAAMNRRATPVAVTPVVTTGYVYQYRPSSRTGR